MPNFSDKTLKCRECGSVFIWTAGEQEFYQRKGFDNPPVRCPSCRQIRKQQRTSNRQMYEAVCAKCGKSCQVPFMPKDDRPVYCSDCFRTLRK